ncbi:hypothetical protein DRH14_03045 [Candidatus Shapirobacteria bacterium]|nr:MAG: hypothetical protein DRH14_03045 [Candidatus Shapirobacteria bacterium]
MKRKSISKYPDNWPEIARNTKEEARGRCVRCGHPHNPKLGYTLTVHHLDLNPTNCEWWNMPALCQRCHLQIQSKVVMEQLYMFEHTEWFKPYVAGYYASINGHPTDKKWVMEHLEFLLDYGRIRKKKSEAEET